jgi:hypothetical protein
MSPTLVWPDSIGTARARIAYRFVCVREKEKIDKRPMKNMGVGSRRPPPDSFIAVACEDVMTATWQNYDERPARPRRTEDRQTLKTGMIGPAQDTGRGRK